MPHRPHPPHSAPAGGAAAAAGLFLVVAALLTGLFSAGPLMQSLTERAALHDVGGRAVHFGFRDYLGVGLLGFGAILAVAIVRTLWAIA